MLDACFQLAHCWTTELNWLMNDGVQSMHMYVRGHIYFICAVPTTLMLLLIFECEFWSRIVKRWSKFIIFLSSLIIQPERLLLNNVGITQSITQSTYAYASTSGVYIAIYSSIHSPPSTNPMCRTCLVHAHHYFFQQGIKLGFLLWAEVSNKLLCYCSATIIVLADYCHSIRLFVSLEDCTTRTAWTVLASTTSNIHGKHPHEPHFHFQPPSPASPAQLQRLLSDHIWIVQYTVYSIV